MYTEGMKVLRDAIQSRIIEIELYPPKNSLLSKAMCLIQKRSPWIFRDPQNPNTYSLATHPKTERWQEQYFEPALQPDVTEYWGIECARIVVPPGEIGILTSIEQVLYEIDGSFLPCDSSHWGQPYGVFSDMMNFRWYMQLEYFDGIQPARFNVSQVLPLTRAALPGAPYSELSEIQGTWYAAQSPKTEVKMIIPGARMLRMFLISPPTDYYRWYASGRLRAYTQTTYSQESAENARRN